PVSTPTTDGDFTVIEGADTFPENGDDRDFPSRLGPASSMLRIGTPVDNFFVEVPESALTLTQRFIPSGPFLEINLAVASYEPFGDDEILIELIDPQDPGRVFPMSTVRDFSLPVTLGYSGLDTPPSCSQTPCRIPLFRTIVNNGLNFSQFDNGAFVPIRFGNLPQQPRELELRVSVINGRDGNGEVRAATWAYLEGPDFGYPSSVGNQPPTAVARFYPGDADNVPGSEVFEGDFTVFDCTESSDPEGDDFICRWTVDGPNGIEEFVGNYLVYTFPDEGPNGWSVELTVEQDPDTFSTTQIVVPMQNAEPVINLLNVEVLEDGQSPSICRFADPGWIDTHDVQISFSGQPFDMVTRSEAVPSFASGFGATIIDAAALALDVAEYTIECAVTDNDGGLAVDTATMTLLSSDDVDTKEALETTAGFLTINGGNTIIARIDSAVDMDLYEIRDREGNPLVPNSEVNVIVDVPADYDAVLLSRTVGALEGAPFVNAPFVNVPFVNVPFVNVPFVNVPFVNVPFVNAPFVNAPFVNAPFVNAPFVNAPFVNVPLETSPWGSAGLGFENLPLSQVGLAAPRNGNVAGSDIAIADFPALDRARLEALDLNVRATSGNRTNRREHMLIKVAPGEEAVFLAVVPGARQAVRAPYSVSVEVAFPPSQKQLLGAACDGDQVVPLIEQTDSVKVVRDTGAPTTLIVTQLERFAAVNNNSIESVTQKVIAPLEEFFAFPTVNARVISVPSALYREADADTCSIELQNTVASAIRDIVQAELAANPSIRYVQLLGGTNVIPHHFTPDEVQVGFEGLYAQELIIEPASPTAVGFAEGYNTSDAPYVDRDPLPYRGRELYLEDVSIARLVETPDEILQVAEDFLATNGELAVENTLAFGYDFFIDGTQEAARAAAKISTVETIANDNWTVGEIAPRWFEGSGDGSAFQFNIANGHATYFAMVSAGGYPLLADDRVDDTEPFPELLRATEQTNRVPSEVTLSIGCHSGLSMPSNVALFPEVAEDWVQQRGNFVGPITYGLGHTAFADRGTEGIITLVVEELTQGYSLGEAVVRAKLRYALGLYEFDPHDEKSLIGLNVYGMPQLRIAGLPVQEIARVDTPELRDGAFAQAPVVRQDDTQELRSRLFEGWKLKPVVFNPAIENLGTVNFDLTFDGGPPVSNPNVDLERRTIAELGEYYTYDGLAQGVVGRPAQPLYRVLELHRPGIDGPRMNGVVLRGGTYIDFLDRDPLFVAPEHDWADTDEPQACVESFTPSRIAGIATTELSDVVYQTALIQGGQFKCTDASGASVRGTLRIYDNLEAEITSPSDPLNDDVEPPQVVAENFVIDPDTGDVTATLNAADASGIREIVVLVYTDNDGVPGGEGTIKSFSTGNIVGMPGPFTLLIPDAANARLAVQYVGDDGTIAVSTGKGHLLDPIVLDIQSTTYVPGPSTVETLVAPADGLANGTLTVDFGDGSEGSVVAFDPFGLPTAATTLNGDGSATIRVPHDYAGVTGPVSVVAQFEAPGAEAADKDTLTPVLPCSDPVGDVSKPNVDIVSCDANASGGVLHFSFDVAGTARKRNFHFQWLTIPTAGGDRHVKLLFWFNCLFAWVDGSFTPVWSLGANASLSGSTVSFAIDASTLGWNGDPVTYSAGALRRTWRKKVFDRTAPALLVP
ncbi:MAG: hypothetical protein AAF648_09405, partial [Pseudomonadota bacterium]